MIIPQGKAAIHLVSAFATEQGLALAQVKTEDKSSSVKKPILENFLGR